MRNPFKTKPLPVPTGETKDLTEVESWTVKWETPTCLKWSDIKVHHKVFTDHEEALEFGRQLRQCANFIDAPLEYTTYKN